MNGWMLGLPHNRSRSITKNGLLTIDLLVVGWFVRWLHFGAFIGSRCIYATGSRGFMFFLDFGAVTKYVETYSSLILLAFLLYILLFIEYNQ
jgi:hypothetical protein